MSLFLTAKLLIRSCICHDYMLKGFIFTASVTWPFNVTWELEYYLETYKIIVQRMTEVKTNHRHKILFNDNTLFLILLHLKCNEAYIIIILIP